jgi:hypothetical protein
MEPFYRCLVPLRFSAVRISSSARLIRSSFSVKEDWKDRFSLPVEDYLHGLISMVNELASVTFKVVSLPLTRM